MNKKLGFGILLCLAGLTVLVAAEADQGKLASANTGFAFDLLKQITREQPGTNIFISPFSVSTVLQMVANGAAGETKTEMQQVLKTAGLAPEALNAACKDLNQSLNSQTNVILNLANAIWHENWIHITPAFIADNQCFQVKIAGVDSFTNPKSADIINDWAEKNTHGKIKQAVKFPFPGNTRVVLANAIYFKGKWAEPFEKSQTKSRDFHLSNDGEKQVPMMRQSRTFSYEEGDDFQAVRLPYAGDRLQMYLFLPATNSSPQKLLAHLDSENWHNKKLPQFSDRKGTLVFPKFKLDYDVLLNNSLEALGMKRAFVEGGADFSQMVDNDNLFITMVKQKSFVDVNEEGTEAAAVTTVTMSDSIAFEPQKPFEMIVDRPFLFVIADDQTKSVLFMGVIYDPAG